MNARGESIRELSELFRINRAGIPRPLLDRNDGVGGGAAAAAAAAASSLPPPQETRNVDESVASFPFFRFLLCVKDRVFNREDRRRFHSWFSDTKVKTVGLRENYAIHARCDVGLCRRRRRGRIEASLFPFPLPSSPPYANSRRPAFCCVFWIARADADKERSKSTWPALSNPPN